MNILKTTVLLSGTLFALATTSQAGPEDEARQLVEETLEQMYSHQIAPVWESFSERSKEEYRTVFLAYLTAQKELGAGKSQTKMVDRLEISFASDEAKQKQTEIQKLKPWELELKQRGFSSDLDLVKQLTNQEFWEMFLSEEYLKDQELRKLVGYKKDNPLLNTRKKPFAPTYHIDAVNFANDRAYAILRAPHGISSRLFKPLSPFRTSAARSHGADSPEVQLIWSGTVENGKLRLDIPISMIETLKVRTHRLKSKQG